jgi:hypothetical protein
MAEFPSLILDPPYENFSCTMELLDCDAILTSIVSSVSKIFPQIHEHVTETLKLSSRPFYSLP